MYGKMLLIEFFNMKQPYDLYLMYSTVIYLDKLYLFEKDYFHSIRYISRKMKINIKTHIKLSNFVTKNVS